MYSDSTYTTSEIARRFGVCMASITNAAKRAGLPLRKRGRWPQAAPPLGVQEILLEAWTNTYDVAATHFGLTKQRVAKIVDRWRDWATSQFGPRQLHAPKPTPSTHQAQPAPKREPSPHVVSFRVPTPVFEQLTEWSAKIPSGLSPSQVARSLLLQHLTCQDSLKPKTTATQTEG